MTRVVSDQFPFLEIAWEVRGIRGQALAFIDTGFDGFLMLPTEWMQWLGVPDRVDWWQLADGSYVAAPTYFGHLCVVGIGTIVYGSLVVIGNETVVGLDLIRRYLVILERGQRVIVEP